jgi:hypothetical protein
MLLSSILRWWKRAPRPARPRPSRPRRHYQPQFEALEDRWAPAVLTVTGVGDAIANDGVVTLREAITAANANHNITDVVGNGAYGADIIQFIIPGKTVHTITLTQALPKITDTLAINGYSQPGALQNGLFVGDNAKVLIELDGSNAGNVNGLDIEAANSSVTGLVINRFGENGILLSNAPNTVIVGNFIGTDPTGKLAEGNDSSGIEVQASSGVRIGDGDPVFRNIISGNHVGGLDIVSNSLGVIVQGNYIGTDATGNAPLGNKLNGIFVFDKSQAVIGGIDPGQGNVISANLASGINLHTAANVVKGNLIGVGASGAPLGNLVDGVDLLDNTNLIGGLEPTAGNTIAFNEEGVFVLHSTQTNAILGNSIFSNQDLGIFLQDDANAAQAAPVLLSALSDGSSTVVQGTLHGLPVRNFRIELFSNDTADPSGFGEGQHFLVDIIVKTDGQGDAHFTVTLAGVHAGQFITATATDGPGNTSTFSRALRVSDSGFTLFWGFDEQLAEPRAGE